MPKQSILVVEDEKMLRKLLEYRLGKHYEVETAANGEDALACMDSYMPDLIISDIMMPKMDGFALQSALQSDKNKRVIPFIFLTARSDEPARQEGARMGVDDYITKPFDIDQLLTRIDRLLERTQMFQTKLDAEIGEDFSNRLMPKRMPSVEGYRIRFFNKAYDQGGGDLFDWIETDDGNYFFTVGDVMGKGVRAKFYAFSFLSYVRGTLHAMLKETDSPAELLRRVNEMLIKDEVMEETFASLLLLNWNPDTHRVTYANAGHCRPVLVGPHQSDIVAYSDLVLGLEPNAAFQDSSFTIPPKGALVLYTDGLLEQRLPSGETLGEQGIVDLASASRKDDEPTRALLARALQASNADSFQDDILVFWLQRALAKKSEAYA